MGRDARGLLFDIYWYDGKLTDADNVELKTTLEELALDLAGDAVEANVALRVDACSRHGRHFRRRKGWYRDNTGQESNRIDVALAKGISRP